MASVFDGDYRLCCKFEVLLNLNIVLGAQVVFFLYYCFSGMVDISSGSTWHQNRISSCHLIVAFLIPSMTLMIRKELPVLASLVIFAGVLGLLPTGIARLDHR